MFQPMQARQVHVRNPHGLHARAAAKIVLLAAEFESSVLVCANGRLADARNIAAAMLLAAGAGSVVRAEATGADETEAVDALSALIQPREMRGRP